MNRNFSGARILYIYSLALKDLGIFCRIIDVNYFCGVVNNKERSVSIREAGLQQ